MKGAARRAPWAILAIAVFSGCPPAREPIEAPRYASADREAEASFRLARDLFDSGDLERSDRAFEELARSFPSDPLVEAAALYRGRIALALGDLERAREILDAAAAGEGPVAERAALYGGVASLALGEAEAAIEALTPFVGRLTDPEENLLLLDTLWRAAGDLDDAERAARWIDAYLAAAPPAEGEAEALEALAEICRGLEDPGSIRELERSLSPGGRAWTFAVARRAEVLYASGDLEAAGRAVEEAERAGRADTPVLEEIASLVERRSDVDLATIGCILPLSGRSRLVGEAVLRGAMIGAKTQPGVVEGMPLSIAIRDSGADPERAAEAVRELVFEERVAAIVGPVDAAAAESAAGRAEELGVPMLVLSVREGLSEIGGSVFREFVTSRAEVAALVEAAVDLGGSRFAILFPDDGYGRAMRREHTSALAERGLEPVAEVSYPAGATAFDTEIELLAEAGPDVLFVPDRPGQVALVAPALAAAGLWSGRIGDEPPGPGRSIQLIFPSVSASADLPRRAGRYLQEAVFASLFHPEASPGAADFSARFADEYGGGPSHFSAFGHDAVVLIAEAVRAGARSREGIRRWLARESAAAGESLPLAAPFAGFGADGGAAARPWTTILRGDGFEVLR